MIVLINPNSTVSMTQAMLRTARAAAPMADIQGWTSHDGPASIQGPDDGLAAEAPLIELVDNASLQGATAIIIGCFDDTGLHAGQNIAACPVIGIGQAAYHLATVVGGRFSVVTTLAVSVPILEDNIKAYGLAAHLGKVRASGVPVLDLENDSAAATDKVMAEMKTAVAEDNIKSVVLGCGGMVDLQRSAAQTLGVPVIDGVRAAALFACGV